MFGDLRVIHNRLSQVIATVSVCMTIGAVAAHGQVVDAHYDNSLTTNESAYCPHENAIPLDGQVRTADHSPLPKNLRVILETSQGTFSDQQFPGADGRFRFLTVQGNKYRVVVTADGFQRATQNVDDDWGASHSPTIYLVPSGTRNAAPAVDLASDQAAPKHARKEYEAGDRALQAGNFPEAQKHLERAVSEDACYARAQTALGMALAMQHQMAGAESAFTRAIQCEGGLLEPYLRLALLLKSENRYPQCASLLEQGVRRLPEEWSLHYQLGNAQAALGDYAGAEQELLKAQTLNASAPAEIHVRLAEVYRDGKQYDKARAEAATYLRLDPQGPMAEAARKMLEELRASGAVNMVDIPNIPAHKP
jgi:tetratricopeptide (TPR) repeat protein